MLRGMKKRSELNWKRPAMFLLLLAVLTLLLNSLLNVYKKNKEAEETLAKMQKELGELQNRDKYLEETIQRLATEEGIKDEIRRRLNMAQAGENVAIIVEEDGKAASQSAPKSAWQKIKNFFSEMFR